MSTQELQELLASKGEQVSIDKAEKIRNSIETSIHSLDKVLKDAGYPAALAFKDVNKVENDISWEIIFTLSENHHIN